MQNSELEELLDRAMQGDPQAQYKIGQGWMNTQGIGDRNFKEALFWWLEAADNGFAPAMSDIGVCYALGKGVEQDYSKAIEWFTKGTELGDSEAQFNLGVVYETGQGVPQNVQKAMMLYRMAAELGNMNAMYALGLAYIYTEDDEKCKEGVEWLAKAAELGHRDAITIFKALKEML